ncbi:phenylacetate-coenzyme A ligase PaaK-like adenylate-forming protein [Streptomyces sp. 3211.6]|uniref:acyl-CoA reductase n=1 Tax=Streptomyces sp. 3211.6 TaxID=1938845 RepID=UPI000F28E368|nr:acyl-CoA reductase [Streptomyces sp. 3211.6]RKT08606.1 phenylacetate-coenzyme A ligase PaaK-like adenylate-forming protein [Streptomyces sp. 3211.6]
MTVTKSITEAAHEQDGDAGAHHYWQGAFIGDEEAGRRLAALPAAVEAALATVLDTETVLAACDALATALGDRAHPVHTRLAAHLPPGEDPAVLAELGGLLGRRELTRKLRRELGGAAPGRLDRPDPRESVYEAWAPVGLVAHIAPGNATTVAPLSIVEGLLAGNVNVLKTSSADTLLTQHLMAELAALDPSGALAARVIVLRFPSSRQEWLRLMCAPADAVAVWGGEDAVQGVAAHVPAGCRLVEWGHRISFAYLTGDAWSDPGTLDALADDVCRHEQQACSSPQVVYLDTEDEAEVFAFAERFAAVLATRPPAADTASGGGADPAEAAELTTTELVARLEEHLGLTRVFAASDGSWRVMADTRSPLTASPLHRSVWVKPLARRQLIATLRPMRRYLQTAGIAGSRSDIAELSRTALAAGVTRVTPVGAMTASYAGEPHDGVYALQRYSRRVAVQADPARFATTACLDDLVRPVVLPPPAGPLLGKEDVQGPARELARADAELYFRSGGSTGAPALSVFSYDDYDTQMHAAARGLLAAGYDPAGDRTANLFYCGGMYGSFISFFSVLERLGGVQLPLAAGADHRATVQAIVEHRADTLFGMPSYLWQLLHAEADALRAYGGLRKVFYGGEHFTREQQRTLKAEFGIEVIRSITYGSTDLGPLGYQCADSSGGVHHLHADLHTMEIVDLAEDRPVAPGETGRLVFTTHARRGQQLGRYLIGDLGREVPGRCPCGRRAPRFELMGRTGDVMRVATHFLNHRRFLALAEEQGGHRGELQIRLDGTQARERLTVRVERGPATDPQRLRQVFLSGYPELRSAVTERLLDLVVEAVDGPSLDRSPTSGKLLAVVDARR